jgi:hypothetical protein
MKNLFNKDFALGFLTCLCILLLTQVWSCGRTLSRFGFGDQTLNLPKDFKAMVSVGFHKNDQGETIKDLTYETIDGDFRSIEYKDKPWQLEGSIRWERPK